MFEGLVNIVRERQPLVLGMTNYVTVNDCANALIAIGGSPVMSDQIEDAVEIAESAGALVINIGTPNDRTVEAFVAAGKSANKNGIPVVLDPAGVGTTKYRTEAVKRLLSEVKIAVIRGNAFEINAICSEVYSNDGIDALESNIQSVEDIAKTAKQLSQKTGAVVAVSGKADIVANANEAYTIRNGSYYMGKIIGSGCMLTCIIGAFIGAVNDALSATVAAVCAMGIAGEYAEDKMQGMGSFKMYIIDGLSNLSENMFKEKSIIEKI